jgi:plastocyanin
VIETTSINHILIIYLESCTTPFITCDCEIDDEEKLMKTRLCLRSFIVLAIVISSSITLTSALDAFGQNIADELYENKSMTLPQNIRHLVILVPNEAHESQTFGRPTSEDRLIDQPYVPQKTIVSPGTMVIWFNADVDHDHKITLTNSASSENVLFDSGIFAFNGASRPVVLNDTGSFNYYEANVNEEDPNFVMNGTITVVAQQQGLNTAPSTITTTTTTPAANSVNSTSVLGNADTAGVLMVPTMDTEKYVQDLKSKGFAIDSTHDFEDIRAGDQQTLLVWTTSGIDLDQIISTLQELTPQLPYS